MRKEKELRELLGFKDDVAYHYCSLSALFGILSSKSFWLTSLESSNDSTELKIGKKILEQAIGELKKEFKEDKQNSLLNKIENAPKDKKYIKYRPKYKYFGLSFVEENDSLTHWERYADNSQGVCVGFNLPLLKNLFVNYNLPDIVTPWFQIAEVLYKREEQIEFIKSYIKNNILKSEKFSEVDLLKVEGFCSSIYYSALSIIRPRFKHFGFASERERRIYIEEGEAERTSKYLLDTAQSPNFSSKELFQNIGKNVFEMAKLLNILGNNKKFGLFKNGIRGYYSMNLSKIWSSTLITEIVLGPKCFQNKNELKNFARSCGLYETDIQISKVPLR